MANFKYDSDSCLFNIGKAMIFMHACAHVQVSSEEKASVLRAQRVSKEVTAGIKMTEIAPIGNTFFPGVSSFFSLRLFSFAISLRLFQPFEINLQLYPF